MIKKIKSALISVSDKSNLKPLLQNLKKNNVEVHARSAFLQGLLLIPRDY